MGKISTYPAMTTLAGTEILIGDQAGATAVATANQIKTFANAGRAASGSNSDITALTGLTTPLSVAQGGTGKNTLTTHGLVVGEGTSAVASVAVGTAGQVLLGQASADPAWGTVSGDGTISASGVLTVPKKHPRSDKTSAYSIVQADMGTTVRGDCTAGAMIFTLPASATNDGDFVTCRKTDSGTNRLTVQNSSAVDVAWQSTQYDSVTFAWWNGVWVVEGWRIAPLQVIFTATGTLTKPPLATMLSWKLIGNGGGGGSGAREPTGTIRTGGGGGAAGTIVVGSASAAAIGATETITIPTAPAGGAAQTVDTTAGNAGTNGSSTTFGSHALARGGLGGAAGTTANAAGGVAQGSNAQNWGVSPSGASSSSTATSGAGGAGPCGSGAGGGGADAANVARAPGAGGNGSTFSIPVGGGTAGTAGVAGGVGTSVAATDGDRDGGAGGGGGFFASATAGTAGGAGGSPGGGGGGGAAADNGSNSGAGGAGGRGEARFVWSFS